MTCQNKNIKTKNANKALGTLRNFTKMIVLWGKCQTTKCDTTKRTYTI